MQFSCHSVRGHAAQMLIAAGLAATALVAPALAGPEHRLVADGNEAFERQEYDAAAALYQEALDKVPSFSEAAYNRACALVALEQFELVPDLLRNADLHAPSDEARGRARFNLGAAFYRSGQAITAEDPKEAINRFKAAAAGFKAAVRVNPQDDEAKKALELSRRAIRLIEDQLAMPQNLRDLANAQRQQGDEGEQGEQQGEQGEGEQPQPQKGEGQQGQQGQQGKTPGGKGRDRAQEMRETIDQAREQGVQTDPENQPGAEQDIREAEEAMQSGSPEDAARELEEAAEKLERNQQQQQQNQEQQGDQQQQGEEGEGGDQAEDGPESESAVDHVIKQLLEKEREERERRMQYLNPRRPVKARVDKDW